MKVRDYLKGIAPEQFHIFDSHQEGMDQRGVNHADQDYVAYSYNIHKNNKPRVGDAFLYRRPGKSSKTRKFYIYGGGVISDITDPDGDGNVLAYIDHPFKLKEPLMQGENRHLEEFEWTSKEKSPGSWGHFWNQYGMNVIDEHDFFGLVGDLECSKPGNYNLLPAMPAEMVEEEDVINSDLDVTGFQIDMEDEGEHMSAPSGETERTLTGRHIDYEALQHMKGTLGKAGELLVVEMLQEKLEGTGALVEHTSVYKGDGYGYDIKVIYPDGSELQIEVKTTKTKNIDGFYITPRELNAARQCEGNSKPAKKYQVYRVYNFDPEKKTANLKIYDTPFDDKFRFVTVSWKVYIK